MEIIANTTNFVLEKETAAAIGKFDGIHIGHRRLLEEILSRRKDGLAACVFTFDPPPAFLFAAPGDRERTVLTTKEEKRLLFERMGVDILIEFPLNNETAAISPGAFAEDILAGQMNVRFLAAGRDLSFGARGAGNAALLREMGPSLGFGFLAIDKVCVDGKEVSSTLVRNCVEVGDIGSVRRLLGMPYLIAGKVQMEEGHGSMKLLSADAKLLPPKGAYISQLRYKGKRYNTVSNVQDVSGNGGEGGTELVFPVEDCRESICGGQVEMYLLEKK